MTALAAAWLFVPGDRPERFDKAAASGADEIILDLEDAVSPEHKGNARSAVAQWLHSGGHGWVRVNPDSVWLDEDVRTVAETPGLRGVIVPKAEESEHFHAVAQQISGRPIVALIETAIGVDNVASITRCAAVARLAFGSIDFAVDIDATEDDESLLWARSALVLASRVARLPAPIDGVTVDTRDELRVAGDATRARKLGFGGKLCIHPRQIAPVTDAFRPRADEIIWAERILGEAASGGAISVDGRMVDAPVLARAHRIVSRAGKRR